MDAHRALRARGRATGGRKSIVYAIISISCVKLGSFCKNAAPTRERRAAAAARAPSRRGGTRAGAARHGAPKGTGRGRVPPCYSMKQTGYAKLASFCKCLFSASPPRSAARAAAAARLAQDAPADSVRAPRTGPDRARIGSRREPSGRGSARAESARASAPPPPARFSPAWRDPGPGAARRAPHHGPATLSAGRRRADHDPGETCGLGQHPTGRGHTRLPHAPPFARSAARESPTSPRPSPPLFIPLNRRALAPRAWLGGGEGESGGAVTFPLRPLGGGGQGEVGVLRAAVIPLGRKLP